jgi:hypothetical protein
MNVKLRAIGTPILAALALLAVADWGGFLDSAGAWVPFVAQRESKSYRVSASGKVLAEHTSGLWLRNSQGSLYERDTPIFTEVPQAAYEAALLFDNTNGTTYQVDYAAKTIKVLRRGRPVAPPEPDEFRRQMPKDRFIGGKTIAGVVCERWQTVWAGSVLHSPGEAAGEECDAPSLNFTPLEIVTLDDGIEDHTIVTAINVGVEPDPTFFRLPENFRKLD